MICVMKDGRIGRQIEGYMCSAKSLVATVARGDGKHVRYAFEEGKRFGIFADGDPIVCVHTTRNSEGVKQFMVRILFVTAGDPHMYTRQGIDRRPTTETFDEPPAKKTRK